MNDPSLSLRQEVIITITGNEYTIKKKLLLKLKTVNEFF